MKQHRLYEWCLFVVAVFSFYQECYAQIPRFDEGPEQEVIDPILTSEECVAF